MTKPACEYEWPPPAGTFPTFAERLLHNRKDTHRATVRRWLFQSPAVAALPETVREGLVDRVWGFDDTATQIQAELDKAGWSPDRLRTTVLGHLTSEQHSEWTKNWHRVRCLECCRQVRDAIFKGDWPAAIAAAAGVGQHSLGGDAHIGSQIRERRRFKAAGDRHAIYLRKQKLAEEADKVWAKSPGLNDSETARRIQNRHKHTDKQHKVSYDAGYESLDWLRKNLPRRK